MECNPWAWGEGGFVGGRVVDGETSGGTGPEDGPARFGVGLFGEASVAATTDV